MRRRYFGGLIAIVLLALACTGTVPNKLLFETPRGPSLTKKIEAVEDRVTLVLTGFGGLEGDECRKYAMNLSIEVQTGVLGENIAFDPEQVEATIEGQPMRLDQRYARRIQGSVSSVDTWVKVPLTFHYEGPAIRNGLEARGNVQIRVIFNDFLYYNHLEVPLDRVRLVDTTLSCPD